MNSEILKDFKINKISIKGKSTIIDDRYVLKENKTKYYDYLPVRDFMYFPDVEKVDDKYIVTKYIEDKNMPINQRLEDMIYLVSILHNHTSYDKEIDIDTIKEKYEYLIDKLDNLMKYYLSLQDLIEDEEYMSPANYLLIRNVSLIYMCIRESRKYLDKWYKKICVNKKVRYVYTHGNLEIDHLLENDKLYLISWDKSKLDLPIYDIENFYRKNFNNIKLDTIMKIYSKKYILSSEELDLLFCILLIPDKIDMNKKEYPRIKDISNMLLYLEDTIYVLKNYSKEHDKEPNK